MNIIKAPTLYMCDYHSIKYIATIRVAYWNKTLNETVLDQKHTQNDIEMNSTQLRFY